MSDDRGLPARLRAAMDATGASATELTVLTGNNDPYRVETPGKREAADWLLRRIEDIGLGERTIHLRVLHYLSLGVPKPDGRPYENVYADFKWLAGTAGKAARWLGLLPWEQVEDHRNAPPVVREHYRWRPRAVIALRVEVEIPEEIEPEIDVEGFWGDQSCRLVLFSEKSSLEHVLARLADRYQADLYLMTGEISDTYLHRMAADGASDGRRMIVFTFSDCDPAGWQMPISIARKLQAFRDLKFPELEFEVHRVALDREQVREHGLPSTPLKPTERRADNWKRLMGVEQTEIDALAALRPELLDELAQAAIAPFFDETLDERVDEARRRWLAAAQQAFEQQLDDERLDEIRREAELRLAGIQEQIDEINDALRAEVGNDFELPPFRIPAAEIAVERDGLPLIDSGWTWDEQTRRLKAAKSYDPTL